MKEYSTEEILHKTVNLSYVPSVVIELNSMISNTKTKFNDIISIINKDQGIVSRVFKVANSSFYGRTKKAENLNDAVITLGLRGLQFLVIAHAMKNILANIKTEDNFLWKHAAKVSIASKVLAKNLQSNLLDDAMVAGLIHDIGKAFIINVYPETYSLIKQNIIKNRVNYIDAERNVLGLDHTKIGELVTEKWNFPQKLIDVIRYHHHPLDTIENIPAESLKLIDIVNSADVLCNKHETLSQINEEDIHERIFLAKTFDLEKDRALALIEEIQSEWEKEVVNGNGI